MIKPSVLRQNVLNFRAEGQKKIQSVAEEVARALEQMSLRGGTRVNCEEIKNFEVLSSVDKRVVIEILVKEGFKNPSETIVGFEV